MEPKKVPEIFLSPPKDIYDTTSILCESGGIPKVFGHLMVLDKDTIWFEGFKYLFWLELLSYRNN